MRKPVVNYKNLRLSNITSPEYKHLLWLLGWLVYFALYFLTENLIPVADCYSVRGYLDDIIPFCEYFVIPYVGWYLLIVFSLLYFALYNPKNFANLQKYIIITQLVAMAVYIIFPTRQDLRPTELPNDNFFCFILGIIYNFDTNTGVCPSLHVAYSLGIASVWLKEKSAKPFTKTLIVIFVVLICISVVFVKQHSVVDVYVAIPLGVLAETIVFGKYYKLKFDN